MDKFYVIKVINSSGAKGYIFDSPHGIMIVTGGILATQFKTYKLAEKFINNNGLKKNGKRAYIRTNEDIMFEEKGNGVSMLQPDTVCLENETGEKLFYNTKEDGYYFDKADVGYCIWQTEAELKQFVDHFQFSFKTFIKPAGNAKNKT